ncbi:hypothetical protein [Rhizobium sp. AC44/96]|uniref:hypothetical protein n=1 Tax=Rhizobium sp. AC44/96 TaxID=1841654 RepID=UPI000A6505AF|nr:hypothetical protein [Rhizobium sp. AC44/96]
MLRKLSIAVISLLLLACTGHAEPSTSIGVGNPHPVSDYTCQDGTHLAVRLFGDRASVSVNGAPALDLPAVGTEETTYSNGRWTLAIVQGRLSWGVGRAAPSPCTSG